jgi:peptidoglycan/xylan/chitin deacetylase (PgdA/CDA1 family)
VIIIKNILKSAAMILIAVAMTGCGSTVASTETTTTENTTATTTAATTTTVTTTTTEATEALLPGVVPIEREEIDPNGKIIALTFDDGPTDLTPQVLDILAEKNAVATFFLIGNNITDKTSDIVLREYQMGCEIANHSQTHSQMSAMEAQAIADEIEFTNNKIEEITGVRPRFFRPPYINVGPVMFENIDLTFISGYLPNDYMPNVDVEMRIKNVDDNAADGRVILLHDFQGNTQTVEALPTIIDNLRAAGYQLVTVSELFDLRGIEPDHSRMYDIVA